MRQFIVQAGRGLSAADDDSLGATGPTGPTGPSGSPTDIAQTCALQAYTNDNQAQTAQQCGAALLQSDPSLSQSISTIFENVLSDALKEAEAGTEAALAVYGAIEAFTLLFGADIITTVVNAIVADLAGYISAAIAAGAAAAGIAATTTAVAAGASSYGYIGAVIGFIIGATIAIADYLNPHSVEITNGNTYSAQTYVGTNITNAGTWLQQQKTLAGITPQYFANTQNLFLANPTWLWANQVLTGMCQPIPPEQGSGSAVDFIFTQCPGAFELLSRAQFAEACFLVGTTPSKLAFYMAVTKSTGVDPTANPDNNPNNFNPIWSQADLYGAQAWTPDNPDSDVTFSEGGILNPITQVLNWSWPANNPNVNSTTVNASACTPSGNPSVQGDTGVTPTSSNPTYGGRGYSSYYYSSCPNLVTNNNSLDSNGNITGQTDIAQGIFNLQILYPALTTNQCLCIFNANWQAYENWVAQAKAWANSRCEYPDAIHLGTGSTWNLETADVQAIQAQWVAPADCPGSKASAATAAVQTTLKTTALVGGAAAMGLAFYAYKNGMTVTTAAKSLFGTALKAAKGFI